MLKQNTRCVCVGAGGVGGGGGGGGGTCVVACMHACVHAYVSLNGCTSHLLIFSARQT